MLRLLQKIVEVYVLSNVHISIAAGMYILGAYALVDYSSPYAYAVPVMMTIGTFIAYNAHRFIGHQRVTDQLIPKRILFVKRYSLIIAIVSALSFIPILFGLSRLNPQIWYLMLPCGLLTFLYLAPVFAGGQRLRDFPWVKIFVIAMVWAGLFMLPHFTSAAHPVFKLSQIPLFIEKFFFFIAITIPFDYRDKDIDSSQGVVTMATQLDTVGLRLVIVSCLAASIISAISLGLIGTYGLHLTIGLCVFYLISIGFCLAGIASRKELYYLGVLDGLILINGLVYFI